MASTEGGIVAELGKVIQYFKNCYEADNREVALWSVFHRKVEHRHFFKGKEELISDHIPYVPLPNTYAENTAKTLALYEKEKTFFYGAFMMIGVGKGTTIFNQKVCAPLLMYPASLIMVEDQYYVKANLDEPQLNYQVLRMMENNSAKDKDLFVSLEKEIPTGRIGFGEAANLAKAIKKYFPKLDVESMLLYPELTSQTDIKKDYNSRVSEGYYKVVPAGMVGVLEKSDQTLGVLNELEELAGSNDFSLPLKVMLGDTVNTPYEKAEEIGLFPAELNHAQEQVIRAASRYPLSQITGPPGTGKSFTIAALAVEHASRGQSVLIATRMEGAVGVIQQKIEEDFGLGEMVFRGGRRGYVRKLYGRLSRMLNGSYMRGELLLPLDEIRSDVSSTVAQVKDYEARFLARVESELEWGSFLQEQEYGKAFFPKVKKKYLEWTRRWATPQWELLDGLEYRQHRKKELVEKLLKQVFRHQIVHTTLHNRRELVTLKNALDTKIGTQQENYFNELDFNTVLRTFPIWLVNLSDVKNVLPLRKELFDVAIIDEATQCDIASCIPIFQRAKRVVVAGDPNQLRHVSFLSRSRQRMLQRQVGLPDSISPEKLNYRDKSILDLVSDNLSGGDQVHFLNEHYRSKPHIIHFSNHCFYDKTLDIMTEGPGRSEEKCIEVVYTNGTRDASGVNQIEADNLIKRVRQIVRAQKKAGNELSHSIGILSPFRKQVDYLSKKVKDAFELTTIKKHKIMVGTAYSFQGEERDVMLLSFGVDQDTHHSAYIHLNKEDVFNVSVTRARELQVVFTSVQPHMLPYDSYLRAYLEHAEEDIISRDREGDPYFDRFSHEVQSLLEDAGMHVWRAYSIAGLVVDLVIEKDDHIYGIDLIGYPGAFEDAFRLERYRMLERAGVSIFPLPYTFWYFQRANCIAELSKFLNLQLLVKQ